MACTLDVWYYRDDDLDGSANEPDTLIKIAVANPERLGALLFLSPHSWEQPAAGDTSTCLYATRGEQPASPTLYIDNDTKTPFPADPVLPIDRILAALGEFRQTGERPSCVKWREPPVSRRAALCLNVVGPRTPVSAVKA